MGYYLEQMDVQPAQDLRIVELGVGGAHGRVEEGGQGVRHQTLSRLCQFGAARVSEQKTPAGTS
jgi:hypothetical protein